MSDLVERVARLYEDAWSIKDHWRARQAIAIALEEAAQFVQDECHDYDDAHRIAAAIRAMIPSGNDTGE